MSVEEEQLVCEAAAFAHVGDFCALVSMHDAQADASRPDEHPLGELLPSLEDDVPGSVLARAEAVRVSRGERQLQGGQSGELACERRGVPIQPSRVPPLEGEQLRGRLERDERGAARRTQQATPLSKDFPRLENREDVAQIRRQQLRLHLRRQQLRLHLRWGVVAGAARASVRSECRGAAALRALDTRCGATALRSERTRKKRDSARARLVRTADVAVADDPIVVVAVVAVVVVVVVVVVMAPPGQPFALQIQMQRAAAAEQKEKPRLRLALPRQPLAGARHVYVCQLAYLLNARAPWLRI
jgi:hypothetical protein